MSLKIANNYLEILQSSLHRLEYKINIGLERACSFDSDLSWIKLSWVWLTSWVNLSLDTYSLSLEIAGLIVFLSSLWFVIWCLVLG